MPVIEPLSPENQPKPNGSGGYTCPACSTTLRKKNVRRPNTERYFCDPCPKSYLLDTEHNNWFVR